MRDRTVTAVAGADKLYVKTSSVFQYDYGLKLIINGLTLPESYDVHFCNTDNAAAKTVHGDANGVDIPDEYLRSGENIHAYVYLRDPEEYGYTVYHIEIPVVDRAALDTEAITPIEHTFVEDALEKIEDDLEKSDQNVLNYPYISEDKYWMVYDANLGEFVNTGVKAEGQEAVGSIRRVIRKGLDGVEIADGAGDASLRDDTCVEFMPTQYQYTPSPTSVNNIIGCTGYDLTHEYDGGSDQYSVSFQNAVGVIYNGVHYPTTGKIVVKSVLLTLHTADMDYDTNSGDDPEYSMCGWTHSGIREILGADYDGTFTRQVMNVGSVFYVNTVEENDIVALPYEYYQMTREQWIDLDIDVQILVNLQTPIEYNIAPIQLNTKHGENVFRVDPTATQQYRGIFYYLTIDYDADLKLYKAEDYALRTDTVLDTTLSINRSTNSKVGQNSVAIGESNEASGACSVAFGDNNAASNICAFAIGNYAQASGRYSFAGGQQAKASGDISFAFGYSPNALGYGSTAFGSWTEANGVYAFAAGQSTKADGYVSVAIGSYTLAKGDASFAAGYDTEANGYAGAAFGSSAVADDYASFAAGFGVVADGPYMTAVGKYNVKEGIRAYPEWVAGTHYEPGDRVKITYADYDYVEGYICLIANSQEEFEEYVWDEDEQSTVQYWDSVFESPHAFVVGNGEYDGERSNAFAVGWDGNVHVKGDVFVNCGADSTGGSPLIKQSDIWVGGPNSVGQYALAIGMGTRALGSGSFAGGAGATASGSSSFAFGGGSRAIGDNSFAFGGGAYATGDNSFAIGGGTNAYGDWSIAGGAGSKSYGYGSVAIGNGVEAYGDSAFAVGQENFIDQRQADEWTPNTYYDVDDVVKVATNNSFYSCLVAHTSPEEFSTQDDQHTLWEHIDGSEFGYLFAVGNGTDDAHRSNALSVDKNGDGHFMGDVYANCFEDGTGGSKLVKADDAEFEHSVSMGRAEGSSIGYHSIALGSDVEASAGYSVALGSGSIASGYYAIAAGNSAQAISGGSVAIGTSVLASGYNSLAMGICSEAHNNSAFALGYYANAQKDNSYAIGNNPIADGYNSYAIGDYAKTEGRHSFSIGNGTITAANDSFAIGNYNVADGSDVYSEWVAGHTYHPGDRIKRTTYYTTDGGDQYIGDITAYECVTENTQNTFTPGEYVSPGEWVDYWESVERTNYVLMVGNGYSAYDYDIGEEVAHRSNAFVVGWDGSGRFGGDLYVNCNSDSTGGELVLTSSMKGAANGVAELDANGHVPTSQLPSYVDDVVDGYFYNNRFYEDASHTTEITGETGKVYIDLATNITYRWGGQSFVPIGSDLALGETSSTAYRGDRGKIAYDHASDVNRASSASAPGLYKIGVTSEGHVSSVTPVSKADITGLGIPEHDTTYSEMGGATAQADGSSGLVPAPSAGDENSVLFGDGTWKEIDLSGKLDKDALDNAGITARTYTPLFNGEFTVTTAQPSGAPCAVGIAPVTGRAYKENLYRVTVNGTVYILPVQLNYTNRGNVKVFEYIGNLLVSSGGVNPGIVEKNYNVPFVITFDMNSQNEVMLFTQTAGTYTVLIERINETKKALPNSLIWETEQPPLLVRHNSGSTFDSFSIGVNTLAKANGVNRGSLVAGFGNYSGGDFNYLVGVGNEAGGNAPYCNYVFGGNNLIDEASGSVLLGTGNYIEGTADGSFGNVVIGQGIYVYPNVGYSSSIGWGLINAGTSTFITGRYNVEDPTAFPAWTANTPYTVGYLVNKDGFGYSCNTANSDATFDENKWDFVGRTSEQAFIVGNGSSYNECSNAFVLNWNGDGHFDGDVYVGSVNGVGGSKLISVADVASIQETQSIIDEYEVTSA